MRPQSILISLILSFIFLAFFSCKDDEISTNPNHRLTFSAQNDTVFFDTLFATQKYHSTTHSFKFYNKHSKRLEINKIELLGGNDSHFRINIPDADEPNNPINYNVLIEDNDSLIVFVDILVPDLNSNTPQKIEDDIVFSVNGNRQSVKLLAYSQSVISFEENEVGNYVFGSERPYWIENDLTINGDATFEAGAQIYMHDKANLAINGSLNISGTQEKPVIIRGDRLDYMLQDLPYDFVPGQWGGIRLKSTEKTHEINHAQIRNGQIGLSLEGENTRLNLKNSWIHNFDSCGIVAKNSFIKIENSLISNCGMGCVNLTGGESEFIYVTFANYYSSKRPSANNRVRTAPCVLISNYITDESGTEIPAPVGKADFLNCIIYGNIYAELRLNELEDIPFNYSFNHCLIKAREIENEHFIGILWNKDPLFVNTGTDKGALNFRLQENSPAINQAFDERQQYPFDLDEKNRYADGSPDLGAFEFALEINE